MTEYKSTKRGLQKLGFQVTKRFGKRDVLMEGYGYRIRISAASHLEGKYPPYVEVDSCVYAAVDENWNPISWHSGSRRCSQPGRWEGFNYNITRVPEEELSGAEYAIWNIMRFCAYAGHGVNDLSNVW